MAEKEEGNDLSFAGIARLPVDGFEILVLEMGLIVW